MLHFALTAVVSDAQNPENKDHDLRDPEAFNGDMEGASPPLQLLEMGPFDHERGNRFTPRDYHRQPFATPPPNTTNPFGSHSDYFKTESTTSTNRINRDKFPNLLGSTPDFLQSHSPDTSTKHHTIEQQMLGSSSTPERKPLLQMIDPQADTKHHTNEQQMLGSPSSPERKPLLQMIDPQADKHHNESRRPHQKKEKKKLRSSKKQEVVYPPVPNSKPQDDWFVDEIGGALDSEGHGGEYQDIFEPEGPSGYDNYDGPGYDATPYDDYDGYGYDASPKSLSPLDLEGQGGYDYYDGYGNDATPYDYYGGYGATSKSLSPLDLEGQGGYDYYDGYGNDATPYDDYDEYGYDATPKSLSPLDLEDQGGYDYYDGHDVPAVASSPFQYLSVKPSQLLGIMNDRPDVQNNIPDLVLNELQSILSDTSLPNDEAFAFLPLTQGDLDHANGMTTSSGAPFNLHADTFHEFAMGHPSIEQLLEQLAVI